MQSFLFKIAFVFALFSLSGLAIDLDFPLPKIIWYGDSGGVHFEWSTAQLRAAIKPGAWQRLGDTGEVAPEPGCIYESGLKPLSIVGPYVTYEKKSEDRCRGQGEPRRSITWQVVDARAPQRAVKLTKFFAEDVILKALLDDPIVRKSLRRPKPVDPPRDLSSLMKSFRDVTMVYDTDDNECGATLEKVLGSFAFDKLQENKIDVRLFLELEGKRSCLERPLQLVLTLPIPASLKTALAHASDLKEGFLMDTAQIISGGQVSHTRREIPCESKPSEFCPGDASN